jgi:hypothetical protein
MWAEFAQLSFVPRNVFFGPFLFVPFLRQMIALKITLKKTHF